MDRWDFNYPAFEHARIRLLAAGYDVLCPTDSEQHNDTGKPQTWDWYMRRALELLVQADGVALLPGWQGSKGASLEAHVAEHLGMPLRSVDEWKRGGPVIQTHPAAIDAARQELIAARVRLLDVVLEACPRHLPLDQGDGQRHWCKRCGRTTFGELVGEVGK